MIPKDIDDNEDSTYAYPHGDIDKLDPFSDSEDQLTQTFSKLFIVYAYRCALAMYNQWWNFWMGGSKMECVQSVQKSFVVLRPFLINHTSLHHNWKC